VPVLILLIKIKLTTNKKHYTSLKTYETTHPPELHKDKRRNAVIVDYEMTKHQFGNERELDGIL
jgi:hypothetical protein